MNIIFLEKENLYTSTLSEIKSKDYSLFFSSSKFGLLYIIDEKGSLMGYIDHNLYKTKKDYEIKKFEKIIFLEDVAYINIEHLFNKNLELNSIPVVDDNNVLHGVYVRDFSEELSSNERVMNVIALSVLPAFINEVNQYLKEQSIYSLSIIANDEDFSSISNLLDNCIEIRHFYISNINKTTLVLDLQYSKSYREHLKRLIPCEVMTLENLLTLVLLPLTIDFVKQKGASIYFIEGLLKEKLKYADEKWPQLFKKLTLQKAISNDELLTDFFNGNTNYVKWAKNPNSGMLGGDEVCTNGIHLLMSNNLNQDINKLDEPHLILYGPCFVYGACIPHNYSLDNQLQDLLPNYQILNNGVKNGHSLLNDLLYILNTDITNGDILVDINIFLQAEMQVIKEKETLYIFSEYFNENSNIHCKFLDNTFHANIQVTSLAAHYIKSIVQKKTREFPVPKKNRYLYENNKIAKIDTNTILGKSLMGSYIDYLKKNKRITHKGQIIGSVILTANPITKGHEYLINIAKSKCDILYVFIVEENSFEFTTTERLNLVKTVIKNPDIIVLTTGNLMTAKYTFPAYYQQNHSESKTSIPHMSDIHFHIFGGVVAPLLQITKRYVGSEIKDSVTDYYNQKLISTLPKYGIDVEVVKRLKVEGQNISASKVRDLIRNGNYKLLSKFLSPDILEYIKKSRHRKDYNLNIKGLDLE